VSQVYIAFDLANRLQPQALRSIADGVIEDLRLTWEGPESWGFHYPGEGACQRRETNRRDGVPIDPAVWQRIVKESSAIA
jgi:3-dehydro-L-gulonate 2-dehydrogenase